MLSGYKEYLNKNYKSKNTTGSYYGNVSRYLSWCKGTYGMEPDKLYRANVVDFVSYMKTVRRYKPQTVNAYVSALVNFNEYLIAEKHQDDLAVSSEDFMEMQHVGFVKSKITVDDFNFLGQTILQSKKKTKVRDYAIFLLFSQTGIRREELADIYADDVQLEDHLLLIREGKGRKSRMVVLNSRTVGALKTFMKTRNTTSPFLFYSRQGDHLSLGRLNQIFCEYSKEAKIDKQMSPHRWRHYNATRSKEVGIAEADIQDNLGHSDKRTTRRYFDATVEERVEDLDRL